MIKVTCLILALCIVNFVSSQDLVRKKITPNDQVNGVRERYEYTCKTSYCGIQLLLYSNNTFKYAIQNYNYNVISTGKWTKKNNVLIIKSFIRKNNIPIQLLYSDDTSDMENKFKIAVIRNTKGDLMTRGLVWINSDSIECWPAVGQCTKGYDSIDSLKFVFENGMSSKWIKVTKSNFNKIIPVVQSEFIMSSYLPLTRRYKVAKSTLSFIADYE